MSISLQMLGFDGNTDGLFRAAFMMSGGPIAVGDITIGQKYYDALVEDTGCSRANDTLACLRDVPYPKLKGAINKSPDLFSYQVNGDYPTLPNSDLNSLSVHKYAVAPSSGWRFPYGPSSKTRTAKEDCQHPLYHWYSFILCSA